MAESEIGRLDHRAGVDVVGGPTDVASLGRGSTDRRDPASHLPLNIAVPAGLQPAAVEMPAQRPVEEPSEAELRARLQQARERLQAATASLEAAQQASLRAKAWRHDCEVALHCFAGLGEEISAATIAGLRSESGKPDLSPFGARIAEREAAAAALIAAQGAELEFLAAHERATTEWHEAQRVERVVALHPLLLLAREKLRPEMERIEQRLGALKQAFARGDDAQPWAGVAARLREDVQADLGVQIGDAPQPEAPVLMPVFAGAQVHRRAIPVSEGGGVSAEIDPQEFFRRRPQQPTEPAAIAEMRVREQARRGPGR